MKREIGRQLRAFIRFFSRVHRTHRKVHGNSHHDRLNRQHDQRPCKRPRDDTLQREVGALELGVLFAVLVRVLLAQSLRALLEQDRVVRLREEDGELGGERQDLSALGAGFSGTGPDAR